jgi:acyl-CoA thioester hydrolase
VAGVRIYETPIRADWIDYNGHLQDAYYALILSKATDALMDRVGLDASYRKRTGGTLYTLEMHIHFLHEVKQTDTALVNVAVLGLDRKRIHAAFEILRAGNAEAAATAEIMLLHVHQEGGKVSAAPFPAEAAARLAELEAASAGSGPIAPGSRRMQLRAPAGPA